MRLSMCLLRLGTSSPTCWSEKEGDIKRLKFKADDTQRNFLGNDAIKWEPDLKYPDRNVLPILNGNVAKKLLK